MPARLDIVMQRNEDYGFYATLTDEAGTPIDVTGWTFAMQVRERLNNAVIIQSAIVAVDDPTHGGVNVILKGGAGWPLGSYGDPLQESVLPYDLIATDLTGFREALIAGYVKLSRGITQ